MVRETNPNMLLYNNRTLYLNAKTNMLQNSTCTKPKMLQNSICYKKNKQCDMIKTLQITNAHMLQKTCARYQPACVTEARHGTVQ